MRGNISYITIDRSPVLWEHLLGTRVHGHRFEQLWYLCQKQNDLFVARVKAVGAKGPVNFELWSKYAIFFSAVPRSSSEYSTKLSCLSFDVMGDVGFGETFGVDLFSFDVVHLAHNKGLFRSDAGTWNAANILFVLF